MDTLLLNLLPQSLRDAQALGHPAYCEFLEQWGSGATPAIEQAVAQVEPPLRESLLPHFLAADFFFRGLRGETLSGDDYGRDFPRYVEIISRCYPPRFESQSRYSTATYADNEGRDTPPETLDLYGMELGRYQLRSVLGRGGFGLVWQAYDPLLDRMVAIKLPRAAHAEKAESQLAIIEEARKIARLSLDGVVPVYDCGEKDGRCFIVSKFMEGGTLADRLRRERLGFVEAARVAARVAATLHQAHLRHLVHRDIKPSNILLDRQGDAWVADFGLAVTEVEQAAEREGVIGTYAYMSPEMARGENRYVDARTDIYSLGMVLYEMLTGRVAFSGRRREVLEQIHRREPRPPRTLREDVPAALEQICLKCLAKDVNARYLTAHDLAADLERWVRSQESLAPTPASKPSLARRRLVGGLIAVAVLLAAAPIGERFLRSANSATPQPLLSSVDSPPPAPHADDPPAKDRVAPPPLAGAGPVAEDAPARRPVELERLAWERRLGAAPRELFWPGYRGATSAGFRDDLGVFEVVAEAPRLYALGTLESARHTISLGLRQPHWQASCGVFLGYREEDYQGRRCATFQVVSVGSVLETGGGMQFQAVRAKVRINPTDGFIYPIEEGGYQKLPWPPAGAFLRLELQVSPAGLESARWGNVELTQLLGMQADQDVGADRGLGTWGLFHGGVATWFQDPNHFTVSLKQSE